MNAGIETLCNRVLGALFNGGYQGLLLTGLIWLGLKLVRRTNAATRHAVAMVTLIFVALLPLVHFILPDADQMALWKPAASMTVNERAVPSSVSADFPTGSSETDEEGAPATLEIETAPKSSADFGAEYSMPLPLEITRAIPADSIEEADREADAPSLASGAPNARIPSSANFLTMNAAWWRLPVPKVIAVALVGLWIICASARIGNLAWQYWMLRGLKRRGAAPSKEVLTLFDDLRAGSGTRRMAKVVVCSGPTVPMVAGFWRPAVLLPAVILRDAGAAQMEQILRHELAHVARADDWANLVQQVIKGVLFFHPAVWWLSKRLTIEREIACDDHVLTASPGPQAYALFLTEFARRTQCRDWVAAPAAWSKRSQLTERITMILDSKRNASPRLARAKVGLLTIAAALLAIWGLRAGPRVALAAEQSEDKAAKVEANGETQSVTEVHSDSITPPAAGGLPESSSATSTITIHSGPRPKLSLKAEPMIAANPPHGPLPVLSALAAPVEPDAPEAAALPAAPRVHVEAGRKARGDDSLERRLDRLERMVEKLMAEKKEKQITKGEKDFNFNYKVPNYSFSPDGKGSPKWGSGVPSDEDMARIKDFAKHQAELASKNAERVAREMEKTTQEIARSAEDARLKAELGAPKGSSDGSYQDSFEIQRRSLESARKTLEKQMHALEKQINRLDEEQEKAQQHREADQEKRNNRLNPNLDDVKRNGQPGEDAPKSKHKADSEAPN